MPPHTPLTISTVEMHTGDEPVRIVTSGYPAIPGATILARRRRAREEFDHLRRLLMFEPRGHFDMYGVIPVAPDPPREGEPAAGRAVLFTAPVRTAIHRLARAAALRPPAAIAGPPALWHNWIIAAQVRGNRTCER